VSDIIRGPRRQEVGVVNDNPAQGPAAGALAGRVEVSPEAIATVARTAVRECYGVVGLARARHDRGWLGIVRPRRPASGIDVQVSGGAISITLHVVVEYGVRISEVARNIMSNVSFAVEKALGMPVREVNVHIDDLHITSDP
jgi:uncharacterized alkaline shock family protein YloU